MHGFVNSGEAVHRYWGIRAHSQTRQHLRERRPFLSAAHTGNAKSAAATSSWHQQWIQLLAAGYHWSGRHTLSYPWKSVGRGIHSFLKLEAYAIDRQTNGWTGEWMD